MRSGAFFAAIATTAACGLAPHDESTPAVPGDGTSGFTETGTVEFCLGTARLVAPAAAGAGAIGVCGIDGVEPTSCDANADCRAPEECICGRCLTLGCRLGADCADGFTCDGSLGTCVRACGADADCAADEACKFGGCARRCGDDAACPFGQRCGADGTCLGKSCDELTNCASGRTCMPEQTIGELREPSFATLSGTPYAYVEVRTGTKKVPASSIYRARVASSARWIADPEAPVLAPDPALDAGQVGAPSVVVRGGAVELYFASGGGAFIGRATAADGAAFTRAPAPLLEPADAWEAGRVGSPGVVEYAGATYLFYEGGAGAGIGVAGVADGGATRIASPWLTPSDVADPLFWRAVGAVGTPDPVVVGDALRVYFTGRGVEGSDAITNGAAVPADVNDSIGLVVTGPGLANKQLFPTGPVLARRVNLRAFLGEREPALVLAAHPGEASTLVFVSSDASGTKNTGLSIAVDR